MIGYTLRNNEELQIIIDTRKYDIMEASKKKKGIRTCDIS